MRDDAGWWIINCKRTLCGRRVASNLKVFADRWGEDASSDMIRDNAKCSACGHKGVELTHPSYGGRDRGWEPFPGEGYEITPSKVTG